MKRFLFIFSIQIWVVFTSFAQNVTLSGYIENKATGERLVNATIVETKSVRGTSCNPVSYTHLSMLVLTSFSLVFIAILQMNVQEVSANYEDGNPYIILNMITSIISFGLLIFGTSALLLFKYWIGYSQRIDELASSTLQSELKFLKKQINPHFLFNMLNNANVLIKKNPEEARCV